ncbi:MULTISPECIES: universal stress protein [unclassified Acinetobacter]|uniref:universal stress protein n=1 Tax=unclassified Acinetobacter TaxID=196816 RepID=UPI0025779107|nr:MULTISPECIES: universal stress protein [unclassified Acinetobacter]MDM1758983.1 universal stress protein [Acinetobacter sp. 256-1]MDM1761659.1 universal stress protein [Acinetobacter sp. 251-1]
MTYQHILVPVDGSQISFAAAQQAISLAKAFNSQLTAICLVAEDPFSGADFYYNASMMKEYLEEANKNALKALDQVQQFAAAEGVALTAEGVALTTEVVHGYVTAETIIDTAEKKNIDLIVMGSHGRKGFKKFFLGSFAQDVLNQTTLPVLIVKE